MRRSQTSQLWLKRNMERPSDRASQQEAGDEERQTTPPVARLGDQPEARMAGAEHTQRTERWLETTQRGQRGEQLAAETAGPSPQLTGRLGQTVGPSPRQTGTGGMTAGGTTSSVPVRLRGPGEQVGTEAPFLGDNCSPCKGSNWKRRGFGSWNGEGAGVPADPEALDGPVAPAQRVDSPAAAAPSPLSATVSDGGDGIRAGDGAGAAAGAGVAVATAPATRENGTAARSPGRNTRFNDLSETSAPGADFSPAEVGDMDIATTSGDVGTAQAAHLTMQRLRSAQIDGVLTAAAACQDMCVTGTTQIYSTSTEMGTQLALARTQARSATTTTTTTIGDDTSRQLNFDGAEGVPDDGGAGTAVKERREVMVQWQDGSFSSNRDGQEGVGEEDGARDTAQVQGDGWPDAESDTEPSSKQLLFDEAEVMDESSDSRGMQLEEVNECLGEEGDVELSASDYRWVTGPATRLISERRPEVEVECGVCQRCGVTLTEVVPAGDGPTGGGLERAVAEHLESSPQCRSWREGPSQTSDQAMVAWQRLAKWAERGGMAWRPPVQLPVGRLEEHSELMPGCWVRRVLGASEVAPMLAPNRSFVRAIQQGEPVDRSPLPVDGMDPREASTVDFRFDGGYAGVTSDKVRALGFWKPWQVICTGSCQPLERTWVPLNPVNSGRNRTGEGTVMWLSSDGGEMVAMPTEWKQVMDELAADGEVVLAAAARELRAGGLEASREDGVQTAVFGVVDEWWAFQHQTLCIPEWVREVCPALADSRMAAVCREVAARLAVSVRQERNVGPGEMQAGSSGDSEAGPASAALELPPEALKAFAQSKGYLGSAPRTGLAAGFRVATLNCRGGFGRSEAVTNSARAFGDLLGRYCSRFGVDVMGVQDLNLGDGGRSNQALLGLQRHGYTAYFHAGQKRTKVSQGVGLVVAQRHVANVAEELPATDTGGRSITIDIKMLNTEWWRFTSAYGVPNPASGRQQEAAALLDHLSAVGLEATVRGMKHAILTDANSVSDVGADALNSNSWDPTGLVVRLMEAGFEDAFRVAGHDGVAWSFRTMYEGRAVYRRLDYVLLNTSAAGDVVRASIDHTKKPGFCDHSCCVVELSGGGTDQLPFDTVDRGVVFQYDLITGLSDSGVQEWRDKFETAFAEEALASETDRLSTALAILVEAQSAHETEELTATEIRLLQADAYDQLIKVLSTALTEVLGTRKGGGGELPMYEKTAQAAAAGMDVCDALLRRVATYPLEPWGDGVVEAALDFDVGLLAQAWEQLVEDTDTLSSVGEVMEEYVDVAPHLIENFCAAAATMQSAVTALGAVCTRREPGGGSEEDRDRWWADWMAGADKLRKAVAGGEATGAVRSACRRLNRAATAVGLGVWRRRRQARFLKTGGVSVKTRAVGVPKPGPGNGSDEQRQSAAAEIREWMRRRGTRHPVFRGVLDRSKSQGWSRDRWRYRVCTFAELPVAAQAEAFRECQEEGAHQTYFGLPEVVQVPPAYNHGSRWCAGCTGWCTCRPPPPGPKYAMPGEVKRVPGCLDGEASFADRPKEVPGAQKDQDGYPYFESPRTMYRMWRSLQPAAWLPDGMYDSVGEAIREDSDEWRRILGKSFSSAPGGSQVHMGALRFMPRHVQRLVLDTMNSWLARKFVPAKAKLGRVWKIAKEGGGQRPISLLESILKEFFYVMASRVARIIEANCETSVGTGRRRGVLSANQWGFREGRCAVAPAGIMKASVEVLWSRLRAVLKKKGRKVDRVDFGALAFLDAEKYYDSVLPESIEVCLRARRVPEWLIVIFLEAGFEVASCMLIPPIGISPMAELEVSLRQGSTEAPGLSLLLSDVLLSELEVNPLVLAPGLEVAAQGFADDVGPTGDNRPAFEQNMEVVGGWTRVHCIGLNASKSYLFSYCAELDEDGCVTGREVERDLVLDAFSRGSECVARDVRIAVTDKSTSVRALGVRFNGRGEPAAQQTFVGRTVRGRLNAAARQSFDFPQMRSFNNSVVVPSAIYAPVEAGLTSEFCHKLGTSASVALRASAHELPSHSGRYLQVSRKQGGGHCIAIQQERVAAMASELLVVLSDAASLQGRVYRARLEEALAGASGPNFVRDSVVELAEYGTYVRHRRWELVCRILDVLADSLEVVFRNPVTSWAMSAPSPPSGALFGDVSLLGRLLRRVAGRHGGDVEAGWVTGLAEWREVMDVYAPLVALDETALRAAISTAKGQLRQDYGLEQMMGGFLPELVRGEERWCWRAGEAFGLETDHLQALCDLPPAGYVGVAGSWWASDASVTVHRATRRVTGGGGGVVFGEAPPAAGADGGAARTAALRQDAALHSELAFRIPRVIGCEDISTLTGELIAATRGMARLERGCDQDGFIDNAGVVSAHNSGVRNWRRQIRTADYIWKMRMRTVSDWHRTQRILDRELVVSDLGETAAAALEEQARQRRAMVGPDWRAEGGFVFYPHSADPRIHKVQSHQDRAKAEELRSARQTVGVAARKGVEGLPRPRTAPFLVFLPDRALAAVVGEVVADAVDMALDLAQDPVLRAQPVGEWERLRSGVYDRLSHRLSPNRRVVSLNVGADTKADEGCDLDVDRGDWLRYPIGGPAFAVVLGGGVCTGDVRRQVRRRGARAALASAGSDAVREQGAVYRNVDKIDVQTLESWMSEKELSRMARRMPNGSVNSWSMMYKHYRRLGEEIETGTTCLLCGLAVGDARHALFCPAEEMTELQDEYMRTLDEFLATAVSDGHLESAEDLPARVSARGQRVVGTRVHLEFVSRLGLWGPLQELGSAEPVGRLGDPVTMKTEREDDLGWRGVLPAELRSRLQEVWRHQPRDGESRGVQINAFLLGLVKTVESAARTLWAGQYQLLVQALAALGVEGWAKRGGQERENPVEEEDSSEPVQARCIRGPHCVQISDAGHSGKVRVAGTKCGLCIFSIKRRELREVISGILSEGATVAGRGADGGGHRVHTWRSGLPNFSALKAEVELEMRRLTAGRHATAYACILEPLLKSFHVPLFMPPHVPGRTIGTGCHTQGRQRRATAAQARPQLLCHFDFRVESVMCSCARHEFGVGAGRATAASPEPTGLLQLCGRCGLALTFQSPPVGGRVCASVHAQPQPAAVALCCFCRRGVCDSDRCHSGALLPARRGRMMVACVQCLVLYSVDERNPEQLGAHFAVTDDRDELAVPSQQPAEDAGARRVTQMRRRRVLASVNLAADLDAYGEDVRRQMWTAIQQEIDVLAARHQYDAAAALARRFHAVERARARVGYGDARLLAQSRQLWWFWRDERRRCSGLQGERGRHQRADLRIRACILADFRRRLDLVVPEPLVMPASASAETRRLVQASNRALGVATVGDDRVAAAGRSRGRAEGTAPAAAGAPGPADQRMVSPFSDESDGAVVTVSPRMVLQRGWSVEEAIYLRTRVLQPVIRTKSRELRAVRSPGQWFAEVSAKVVAGIGDDGERRSSSLGAALMSIQFGGLSQGALLVTCSGRTGFLFNQHFLSSCRARAADLGVPVLPTLSTCSLHGEAVATVRWYDPDLPPMAGVDGPSHGVLVHESAHAGVRASLAFVELLGAGVYRRGQLPPQLRVTPPHRYRSVPVPFAMDVAAGVQAAVKLRTGDQLVVYIRVPGFSRVKIGWAVFLAFAGATGEEGSARQTLMYRYVYRPDEAEALPGFVPGCCGSVVATLCGAVIGVHSWGPSADLRAETVGGAARGAADGSDLPDGGGAAKVSVREYVETAELGSLEDFCRAARRGEKAYQYEQAVSVFAVQDCMALWGVI